MQYCIDCLVVMFLPKDEKNKNKRENEARMLCFVRVKIVNHHFVFYLEYNYSSLAIWRSHLQLFIW